MPRGGILEARNSRACHAERVYQPMIVAANIQRSIRCGNVLSSVVEGVSRGMERILRWFHAVTRGSRPTRSRSA